MPIVSFNFKQFVITLCFDFDSIDLHIATRPIWNDSWNNRKKSITLNIGSQFKDLNRNARKLNDLFVIISDFSSHIFSVFVYRLISAIIFFFQKFACLICLWKIIIAAEMKPNISLFK